MRPSQPPASPPTSGSGGDVVTVAADTTFVVKHGDSIKQIVLDTGAVLDNAGTVGGAVATAVEGPADDHNAYLTNHDGGTIKADDIAVLFHAWVAQGIRNNSGSLIEGGQVAVELDGGGMIRNEGAGSIIRSPDGSAIRVSGNYGDVVNTGGASISSGSTTIFLGQGGYVTNGAGSTITATGAADGDCGTVGVCSIFAPSDSQDAANAGGTVFLTNHGSIVGNVQLDRRAANMVELAAGSSIRGDLDIGSNPGASLNLLADPGTTQLYSQAVTSTTTFAGHLYKGGFGTWVIDRDDFAATDTIIGGGTLQIGNGGTTGSIGHGEINMFQGSLVFDRSDNVVFGGDIFGGSSNTLVQAGTGSLTLLSHQLQLTDIQIRRGTLQIDDTGDAPPCDLCSYTLGATVVNEGSLVFDSNADVTFDGAISGAGSLTQNGSGRVILTATNTYSGGTTVNNGELLTAHTLPGNVAINAGGTLDRYTLYYGTSDGVPGVAGHLTNAGKVFVHEGDSTVGGDYTQASSGTLAVSLGSKLDVAGVATLQGGTLEITGTDIGYVSSTRTEVLTAQGGLNGTFDQLVKDAHVVFTATTINYDANSAWLDTTGLDVTMAAAGNGVSYTPVSMGSAVRVQSAFQQLDSQIATGDLTGVSADFLRSAGQFQQAPDLLSAQASLQSLSGQLYATSAAMTLKAIDTSNRTLSDRFHHLLDKGVGAGTWMQSQSVGGDMARAGFDAVGYQLDGWLVGNDRQVGSSGLAGFAFGQSRGRQSLNHGIDRDNTRNIESMLYAGWVRGDWYTQGRVGFGHFQQDVSRQILLGYSRQGVSTRYSGRYSVAYGETGLYFGLGRTQIQPFVSVEYARIGRDSFAEAGGGGFGLRSNAQLLDRWQGAVGMRASHHWDFSHGRGLDLSARAQWQDTLASRGDVFNASFVGLQQWQPLVGIGLSRYGALVGVGLDAALSPRTALKLSYDYQQGQHDKAQTLFAHLSVAF